MTSLVRSIVAALTLASASPAAPATSPAPASPPVPATTGATAPPSAADPTAPPSGGTIVVAGHTRSYRAYRPPNLAPGAHVPLVVMLHGLLGTGGDVETRFHWDRAADAGGFEVVFPEGIDRSWNAVGCCGHAVRDDVDDVAFLEALVASLAPQVDLSRVSVAGFSNGAMMAYRLACESKLRIAAVAAVAGTVTSPCNGAVRPLSVIAIHGTADTLVPYLSRPEPMHDVTVPQTFGFWRNVEHCASPATTVAGAVDTRIAACPAGRSVELISVTGAGHQWPGATPLTARQLAYLKSIAVNVDPPSTALDATGAIVHFFASAPPAAP